MSINKQIKAFTILEALISLLLIGIVIGIMYSLFNLLGKQLTKLQQENTEVTEYNMFNSTILTDIEKATSFNYYKESLELKFYDETNVLYEIKPRNILRRNTENTDTFELKVLNSQFFTVEKNDGYETLALSIKVLNDTVYANYFLKKNLSEIINKAYF